MILMTWIAQYELCIALVRWMGTILILLDFMSLVFTYKEGKGSMSVRAHCVPTSYVPRCLGFFLQFGQAQGFNFLTFSDWSEDEGEAGGRAFSLTGGAHQGGRLWLRIKVRTQHIRVSK